MSQQPTATHTFLFTDIERSTELWERYPDAMRRALVRHDALVRTAIEAHGGHVFKTVGDAFYAVFARAADAVAASLAAQRALCTEPWEEARVRVRMALHTGVAEQQEGDYLGPTLNRVAALISAGHGGQILLSPATSEEVASALPPGVELRSLGERRLKGLLRPEEVFQLLAPDLPSAFPPLNTLDTRPTNLPAYPTSFVGRIQEVAAVGALLRRASTRLVTLTGPGGVGKTRLSLEVAAELLDEFESGVFFVPLAAITDPALVPASIADALQVKEAPGLTVVESLKRYLREKQTLLVLDNFEQVMEAAPFVTELLGAAPRLKVLVSSREVLHVYGEHEYAVPPLDLPDLERLPDVESLSRYEAVALFVERSQASRHDFHLTRENAPAVAEICARLDGLPLAMELAAARMRQFMPVELLGQLSSRLELLTGGYRDLPARQQTLRGAIDWSYNLLTEGERALLRRVAVFAGGWTLEAAEAVCGEAEGRRQKAGTVGSRQSAVGSKERPTVGSPEEPSGLPTADCRLPTDLGLPTAYCLLPSDVPDGLASLEDKSLVQREEEHGEPRYGMLGTIREYGLEALVRSGEAEVVRARHCDWFLTLAEGALSEIEGPEPSASLRRLAVEYDNLRAALGPPLPGALGGSRPGEARHDLSPGPEWLARWDHVVEHLVPTYRHMGRTQAARGILEDYIAFCEAVGSARGLARAYTRMGVFLRLHPGHAAGETTHSMYERAIAVCEAHDLRDWIVYPRCRMASVLAEDGLDLERAEALLRACSPEAESRHDVRWLESADRTLGPRIYTALMWIATQRGDWDGLKNAFQESLPSGGPQDIPLQLMLTKIEGTCHRQGKEARFRDLCHFMADGYARAGMEAPLQQWYLEPTAPRPLPGAPWIDERFDQERWHPALRWQDATGRSHIDRATRPGWLGLDPAGGTNLWPETDLDAPRLLATVQGDFVAQTLVELAWDTSTLAGLLVWRDERHFARLELQLRTAHSERASIYMAACIGGRFRQIGRGQCERQVMWLRVERVGDELRGLCSADGEQWLACGRVRLPPGPTEQVGLAAIPHGPGACAWFDTFLLWRGTGSGPDRSQ